MPQITRRLSMKLFAIAPAIMIGAAMLSAPASAGITSEEAIRAVVDASEFDLTTPTGLSQLNRKIERVAREVCGLDEINRGRQFAAGPAKACYRDAMAAANRRVAELARKEGLGG